MKILFYFSGLLTSYIFLKEVTKKGVSSGFMIKYYIHRIWRYKTRKTVLKSFELMKFFSRILPPYMLCLMLSTCLLPYFGSGPFSLKEFDENCSGSWWTNLFFINNLVRTDKQVILFVHRYAI